jgi:hypothetical protein
MIVEGEPTPIQISPDWNPCGGPDTTGNLPESSIESMLSGTAGGGDPQNAEASPDWNPCGGPDTTGNLPESFYYLNQSSTGESEDPRGE